MNNSMTNLMLINSNFSHKKSALGAGVNKKLDTQIIKK
jgi:hypothetical protein